MKLLVMLYLWLLPALPILAQAEWPQAIADNSFLIEEAYNQEPRVVQHISNLVHSRPAEDWAYAFTQEWPLFSQTHQLSYTATYLSLNQPEASGIGDLMINYRYQLTGNDAPVTLAPRLSVVLPTANDRKGLGSGKTGIQFNLPASKRFSADWVAHANAGLMLTPDVQVGADKKMMRSFHVGASAIWLWRPDLNIMLEWLSLFEDTPTTSGKIRNEASHFISPGLRYARNIGAVQVVPGLAYPIQTNGNDRSLFMYLSLEHSF